MALIELGQCLDIPGGISHGKGPYGVLCPAHMTGLDVLTDQASHLGTRQPTHPLNVPPYPAALGLGQASVTKPLERLLRPLIARFLSPWSCNSTPSVPSTKRCTCSRVWISRSFMKVTMAHHEQLISPQAHFTLESHPPLQAHFTLDKTWGRRAPAIMRYYRPSTANLKLKKTMKLFSTMHCGEVLALYGFFTGWA